MDILNFISWIKRGDYKATLPTDTSNLIAVGAKVDSRDDGYKPLSINAENLRSVYDTGAVTQATSATTAVTLNSYSGVITTVSQTLLANANAEFDFNNSLITADSRILMQAQTASNGTVVLEVRSIGAGTCKVRVHNCGTATMNALIKIHFMILK